MPEDSEEPWFCYMVQCRDGALYVGITNDVDQRVEEHNRRLGPEFTARRRPVRLVWSQEFPDRFAARRKEVELKGWNQQKKLELVANRLRVNPSPSAKVNLSPTPQGKGE